MAKVQGPLHSVTAHGDFAKTLTYRRVGQNNIVSDYAAPTDKRTTAQNAHRSGMLDARAAWRALTPEEKESWNNLAANRPGVSGYNLFIKSYLDAYYSDIKSPFDTVSFNIKNFC